MRFPLVLRISAGFALFACFLAIGARWMSAESPDSTAISNLLAQAKSQAVVAENDAAILESYTHPGSAWETHAAQLRTIAEHVNALAETVKQLNGLREEGSPWQQEAIFQINPLLRHQVDQINATIKHLNDNKDRIHMPAYRNYTAAGHELATRTATAVSDFVEYGKARSKAGSLEQELELPSSGTGK
ncbi:MAG TPA: hypothetical protein VM554_07095 [Acidisarcina sp.]|nr:hypothetical protein [Acidisarcina sp.]